MKVLHVFNRHRSGGGSDNAWDATIALSRSRGIDVCTFERDSRDLPDNLAGKAIAFANGIYPPGALRAFERCLAEQRPDIVHTHELYPLISPFILEIARRHGLPVVHSVYDYRITCPVATHFDGQGLCTACLDGSALAAVRRNCRGNLAESTAFALRHSIASNRAIYRRCVTRFIVLTPFSGEWLTRHAGIDPAAIQVNECAIPVAGEPVDPARSQRAGFAGRLVTEKGAEVFGEAARMAGMEAVIAVPAGTIDASARIAGAAIMATSSREELISFYRSCRFLVVPSLWFETFAIVAAEAMAQGVPVLASDIGALRDTVTEAEAGLHFPMGDAAALAKLMIRLRDDDDLTRELGSGARQRVQQVFNPEAHFQRLLSAYDSALKAGAR